ncbi:hypothetical protein Nepgr_018135 [Nepenthes gracilis]|uniref:Uncharacterized protein n=1 Tax=Nepenthes gracilis TaxID=150966 RepID=A0AAD3SSZ8_NEPGR|nr:hypothetical protein Nepgr_018135 [Nepenthes gracilis]
MLLSKRLQIDSICGAGSEYVSQWEIKSTLASRSTRRHTVVQLIPTKVNKARPNHTQRWSLRHHKATIDITDHRQCLAVGKPKQATCHKFSRLIASSTEPINTFFYNGERNLRSTIGNPVS